MSVSMDELIRTIGNSPEIIEGIRNGTLQIWGGVIRHVKGTDNAGQIVAHLKFPSDPQQIEEGLNALKQVVGQSIQTTQAGFDALQGSMSVLQSLQTANLVLSGLNLAVSAAGFAIVCRKLGEISRKIDAQSAKLDRLLDLALEGRQRERFRDEARFIALMDSAAQFCETRDVEQLKSLVLHFREQYEFTLLVLRKLAADPDRTFAWIDEGQLLQSRLVHLGLFLSRVQMCIGSPRYAEEALRRVADDVADLNRTRVSLLADEAFASRAPSEHEPKLLSFLQYGKDVLPALEYQANLVAFIRQQPEAAALLESDSPEILLLAA
jgi:hypothetical protein